MNAWNEIGVGSSSPPLQWVALKSLRWTSQQNSDKLTACNAPYSAANMALQLVYILFWGFAVMVTLAYVYKHGEEFVNQPRLVKSD